MEQSNLSQDSYHMLPVVKIVESMEDRELQGAKMGYMLRHGSLSKQPYRGDSQKCNIPYFKEDLRAGKLERFKDQYVLYHKGVFCGAGNNDEVLYELASAYYGSSDLALFKVPEDLDTIDQVIKEAIGEF